MIKYGMVTDKTRDDFGGGQVKYVEKHGFELADEANKERLKEPVPFKAPKEPTK